jgi:hypothetical protein
MIVKGGLLRGRGKESTGGKQEKGEIDIEIHLIYLCMKRAQ